MDILELITESFSTLTVNKMRTSLAILGIVIGIGSVIALVSLGQSTQQAIQSQIESLGSNLLTVRPGSTSQSGVRGAMGGRTTLTFDDAGAIADSSLITSVAAVSPEYQSRSQVTTKNANTNTQIVGVTAAYAQVHNTTLAAGNFISASQMEMNSKVAVVGSQVVSDLFGEGADALGQTIRINGKNFTIIGVAASKGGTGFMNQDDIIYVPLSVAQKQLFGVKYLSSIALAAKSADLMTTAQNEVGYLLLDRHKLSDPTQADFSIMSQQDILSTATSTTATFTSLLSGIAAISLLVGGIGIMNIMLVTVTERTREIGLRKALGAKKKLIITQFLIEAILLTFIGGLMGIVLGVVASFIISKVSSSTFYISPISIILATFVSAVIGIIFGWYPAKKAADLQPIEALRYE